MGDFEASFNARFDPEPPSWRCKKHSFVDGNAGLCPSCVRYTMADIAEVAEAAKLRVALLESLLGRAWKALRRDYTNRDSKLLDEIETACPHPSPIRHGHAGRGETRCEIDLTGDVFPLPLLATKEIPVDCLDCLDAFIKEQRAISDNIERAINEAQLLRIAARAKGGQ